MSALPAVRTAIAGNEALRRWISRAFLVSILVYLVVIFYLVAESVTGASRWAPYGVNIPVFIGLVIASEIVVTLTAVWIFKDDAGIWPPEVATGWRELRSGKLGGLGKLAVGAWDVALIDLRLRTPMAIFMGRLNRVAALVPLVYTLVASAGSAVPWGLRGSAIFDVVLTVGVWAFMEVVMVRPESAAQVAAAATGTQTIASPAIGARRKESRYEIRRVRHDDIPRLLKLEEIKWGEQAATRSTIESRLTHYPQGQLAAEHLTVEDGEVTRRQVVAWITVMAIQGDKVKTFGTWDEVSANGTLGTCDAGGDTLIGVNLTSVTNGATYIVLGEMLASVVQWGKSRFVGGGRLNGFVAFNEHRTSEGRRPFQAGEYANLREIRGYRMNELRIEQGLPVLGDDEYVTLVNQQRARNGMEALDAEERPDYVCSNMRGYLSIPGSYVVELIPGYFPDPSSDDWGVVMAWDNPVPRPLRRLPFLNGLVANRIRSEVRAEWEARKARVHERARQRARERAESPGPVPAPAIVIDMPAEPELARVS
jgi:hypothetical protein